jgi:mannosyl-oligosaccharide alpha-1,2-mannosidase
VCSAGWGCTAVDSLTAAILLEVPDAVGQSLDHIATIKWHEVSYAGVAVFGATIRYLGAMLSAYDLLTTTHKHLVAGDQIFKLEALLKQSRALADILSPSFRSPRGINTNRVNFTDGNINAGGIIDITAISGLVLEWSRLSDLTGDKKYRDFAMTSMIPLLNPIPDQPSPFPGLLPKHLDVETGVFDVHDLGGWSHAGGGLYEMLLKVSIYDPQHFKDYRAHWIAAADSTMKHLASHPRGHPDMTFLADFNGTNLSYQQDHSGQFAAASFILGGTVTGEKRFLDFGLELVNTYVKMYASTATGIGPDSIGWIPATCDTGKEKRKEFCSVPEEYKDQEKSGFVKRTGFWMKNPKYLLRPEVLESLYYAFRATGDEKYREASWRIVQNVIKWTAAGSAFAELENVDDKLKVGSKVGRRDWMNSFMLTEVLMYSYIIHLDVSALFSVFD